MRKIPKRQNSFQYTLTGYCFPSLLDLFFVSLSWFGSIHFKVGTGVLWCPLTHILHVFVIAIINRNLSLPETADGFHDVKQRTGNEILKKTDQFKFFDHAAIIRTTNYQASAIKRTKKSEEAEYACKVEGCIMKIGSKQERVLHEKNICSVIGWRKNFVSHKYLIQRQKVHIDERPLKCPWKGCMKTFKWDWAQTEHMRIHASARPYTCGETRCGKIFHFVSDFSRHKRKIGHSGKLEESSENGKKKTK